MMEGPSPLVASLARAADAAWVASGGPLVNEATAAMAEAHSLQLCLLGLQHEINEISTVAAETPTPSSESVEAEAEADDSPMAPRLFEGHQVLDGGGFRTLQHAFATHTECAQAPLTPLPPSMRSEAHAMHTPCTRHAHAMHTPCARHAHAMRTPCTHRAHTARFAHADSPGASRCARRQHWAWSRAFVVAARRPCPSRPSCARGWMDAVRLRPCRVLRR
jgi:hypothetical protein